MSEADSLAWADLPPSSKAVLLGILRRLLDRASQLPDGQQIAVTDAGHHLEGQQ